MKKMIKIAALIVLTPIVLFALYVLGNILYAKANKFTPKAIEDIAASPAKQGNPTTQDTSFTFLTWNIGYGGLGAKADFFYDGGKMVVSDKADVERYVSGINAFLGVQKEEVDFFLLQEVDREARRSWNINEEATINNSLFGFSSAFAVNYDVRFVPVPYTNPMGRVLAGLQSLSVFQPVESKRIQLPNADKFPDQLFYLERCLLMQRYKLANGKDLIVINTHLEAYDDGGVKKKQMEFTKKIMLEEYGKGNYVVMGGDWNIAPPGFAAHKFAKEKEEDYLDLNADINYIQDWKFAFDSTVATNRKNKTAYNKATTFTTIIDYFFVSPNVEIETVKGIDLGFADSDHQPVMLKIKLK
jgi:endonuclease/exonuclease/phosphatase family metal-dependent hydrolase